MDNSGPPLGNWATDGSVRPELSNNLFNLKLSSIIHGIRGQIVRQTRKGTSHTDILDG